MPKQPDAPITPIPASQNALQQCLDCGAVLADTPLYQRYRICPQCRYHYYLPARQRIALLTDPGSFKESNASLVPLDPLSFADNLPYRERLAQAQSVTGLIEAVVTGAGYISGMPAVLAALDFGFMGGSMGSAAGEKITLAAELAMDRRAPLVLVVCGGGPRVQEGALSLMQMIKTVAGMRRLSQRGIPCISILTSPTTGHLYAGAGTAADVILAEPGALIGLAPVSHAPHTDGARPPSADFHTAEYHLEHGSIDRVVDRQSLKQQVAMLIDLLGYRYRLTATTRARLREIEQPDGPAWDRVQLARHHERPTSRYYVERIISNFVELHGDRILGDDPAILTGVGYLAGEAVMVIGQERGRGADAEKCRQGRVRPEGFRKAERALRLAAKFKLPVITFVDTPGAYQGVEADEHGMAGAMASVLGTMCDLKTPILAVIIGQGGSEAALALGMADRTLMMENAIFTPVEPEAAAWILYRNRERADEVASSLKLTAADCRSLGIVDTIIPEPEGGAHADFDEAARLVERMLVHALLDVQMAFTRTLVRNRFAKYRRIGAYGTYFQATLTNEVLQAQGAIKKGIQTLQGRLQGKLSPRGSSAPGEARRLP